MTLREFRIAKGLTQRDVARILDVDQAAVSNWECKKYEPTGKYKRKLARVLGFNEDEMWSRRC